MEREPMWQNATWRMIRQKITDLINSIIIWHCQRPFQSFPNSQTKNCWIDSNCCFKRYDSVGHQLFRNLLLLYRHFYSLVGFYCHKKLCLHSSSQDSFYQQNVIGLIFYVKNLTNLICLVRYITQPSDHITNRISTKANTQSLNSKYYFL